MFKRAFPLLSDPKARVLITGHTGFKGTWLTLLLQAMGVQVAGLSLAPEEDSLFSRLERPGFIPEIIGDIRDKELVNLAFASLKPNIVLHLAAQPLVKNSYENPLLTFETNVMGTAHVLEAALLSSVSAVGVITTDKVYRNLENGHPFKEQDALGGLDPYSASKVGSEAVIMAWRSLSQNKAPVILALRAGNVIGGGDYSENRLLPDIVRAAFESQVLNLRNPESTRPLQHVLDPLFGYVLAIEHALQKKSPLDFNFGPKEKSLTVSKVVEISLKLEEFKKRITDIQFENYPMHESKELNLDSTQATELLSWKPIWTQEQAVISTLKWWESVNLYERNPLELCEDEIERVLCEYRD